MHCAERAVASGIRSPTLTTPSGAEGATAGTARCESRTTVRCAEVAATKEGEKEVVNSKGEDISKGGTKGVAVSKGETMEEDSSNVVTSSSEGGERLLNRDRTNKVRGQAAPRKAGPSRRETQPRGRDRASPRRDRRKSGSSSKTRSTPQRSRHPATGSRPWKTWLSSSTNQSKP